MSLSVSAELSIDCRPIRQFLRHYSPNTQLISYHSGIYGSWVHHILSLPDPWQRAQSLAEHDPYKDLHDAKHGQRQYSLTIAKLIAPNRIIGQNAAEELQEAGFTVNTVITDPKTIPGQTIPEISVEDVYHHAQEYRVLDVREPFEWRSGQIPTATGIVWSELADRLPQIVEEARLQHQMVAMVCATGRRSGLVTWTARCAAMLPVLNVTGGMLRWFLAGYPTHQTEIS